MWACGTAMAATDRLRSVATRKCLAAAAWPTLADLARATDQETDRAKWTVTQRSTGAARCSVVCVSPASRTTRSARSNPAHVPGVALCPAVLLLRPLYACRPSLSFVTLC